MNARWKRIGIPLAFFALVVHFPVVYLAESERLPFGEYVRSLYQGGWQNVYLHLWFLGHLLLYSGAYVAWRKFAERRASGSRKTWPLPNHVSIVGFVVALALITWLVRFWYPIDEWVPLLFVLATEPAHLPQYVSLFTLGVIAYRGDWLRRLSTSLGMVWLGVGVIASAGMYALWLLAPDRWDSVASIGGTNWQSLVYGTWEAVICAGLSVGLIVLFRQVFNRTGRVLAAMAAASYAAYILHWLIVVGLQSGLEGVDMPVLVKFGLVTVFATLLAFGIGHISRRVPGLRVILGTTAGPSTNKEQEPVGASHLIDRDSH